MLHVCVFRTLLLRWGISLSLQNKRCCPHLDIVSLSLPRLAIYISPRLAWHCLMWCHQIWHHRRFSTTTFTQQNFAPNRLGALAWHADRCEVIKSDITANETQQYGPNKIATHIGSMLPSELLFSVKVTSPTWKYNHYPVIWSFPSFDLCIWSLLLNFQDIWYIAQQLFLQNEK